MKPLMLFVCTANISRSPWAELRARQLTTEFTTASAGVHARVGDTMDPEMVALIPEADTTSHRSSPVTTGIVESSALILTMERAHRQFLLEEWPTAVRRIFTIHQFADALSNAPRRLDLHDLLAWCYANRGPDRTDVADPFRRGPAAAASCATEIEGLLDRIVPALDAATARSWS